MTTGSSPDDQRPDADPEPDLDAGSDADSWVAQWSKLFDDQPEPGPQPPTREMPVYDAAQPPVWDAVAKTGEVPGHPDPSRTAAGDDDRDERDATQPPTDRADGGDKPSRDNRDARDSDAAEIEAWQRAQERTRRRAKLRANQRRSEANQRKMRDARRRAPAVEPVRVRTSTSRSTAGSSPTAPAGRSTSPATTAPDRSSRGRYFLAGGVVAAVALGVFGYLLTGFGLGGDAEGGSAGSAGNPADGPDLAVGADVSPQGVADLALSTVQLVGLNDDRQPECAGSGVIVESDGTILTNAHVVTAEAGCDISSIAVAVTGDAAAPAELRFVAEVMAVDRGLDLAVLRIVGGLDGDDDDLPRFRAATLGDSDTVDLGDTIRILGYPVIGGETITLTTGSVSGFTSQTEVGNRALIKTDATISAGNSGGMAVDDLGRVVGIPTKARASESGPAVDCRPLADTNGDGVVDERDNCVAVGGFLNGIRPINLALPLLERAEGARPIGPVLPPVGSLSELDLDEVVLVNPRFALGRNGNLPVDEVVTAQAGIARICFFVDWAGIPAGTVWDGVWFIDGELADGLGFTDQRWAIEEEGENFWLCAKPGGDGLVAGTYEIGFFLEGTLMFAEGITITERPVDVVTVNWSNDTGEEICGLAVNPIAASGQVGLNELPVGETIPTDETRSIELPLGTVVVEAYNCAGEPVADAFDGLPITEEATFVIGL